ncbi:MAG: hypothetical protein GY938_10395, partial [Ketobacter sp.]|nr:hypothetical protein [Ketobacter sp.]
MTDEPVAAEVETEVVEAEAESPEVEAEVSEDTETSVTAEAEEKAEPSESSTEKKKDGFQERISELTGEIYQLRQRAEAAEKANEAPPPEPGKTLADFGYDEEKFSGYLTDVAKAEARAEAEQSVSQEAANNRRSAFETLERAYAAENADYMSLTRAMTTPITDVIVA